MMKFICHNIYYKTAAYGEIHLTSTKNVKIYNIF